MSASWPSPLPSQSAVAHASLRRLQSIVAVAHGLVSAGRVVDLEGIDSAAGQLCAQVLDLPHEEGSALRGSLVELERAIGSLAGQLRTGAA